MCLNLDLPGEPLTRCVTVETARNKHSRKHDNGIENDFELGSLLIPFLTATSTARDTRRQRAAEVRPGILFFFWVVSPVVRSFGVSWFLWFIGLLEAFLLSGEVRRVNAARCLGVVLRGHEENLLVFSRKKLSSLSLCLYPCEQTNKKTGECECVYARGRITREAQVRLEFWTRSRPLRLLRNKSLPLTKQQQVLGGRTPQCEPLVF